MVPDNCSKYEKIPHFSVSDHNTLKFIKEITTITHINSILIALAAHGTQYEENPSIHHGGMHEHMDIQTVDRQMDGLTDCTLYIIPQFHLGRAGNNNHNVPNTGTIVGCKC